MKGIAVTAPGLEGICAAEIKKLGATIDNQYSGMVLFSVSSKQDMIKICYLARSVDRVLLYLGHGNYNQAQQWMKNLPLSKHISSSSFQLRVLRKEDDHPDTPSVEKELGGMIKDSFSELSVDLVNPDLSLLVILVGKDCYVGVDLCGFDLGKREYKLFSSPSSIRGPIGYGLLGFCGYEKKDVLVDPFMGDGVIVIEASLYATGKSVHHYNKDKFAFTRLRYFSDLNSEELFEKLDKKTSKDRVSIHGFDAAYRNVDFGKKNAKIVGMEKSISFSRVESDWLDVKFKEHSVDKMITKLPDSSKTVPIGEIKKLHDEVFYQADFILKKNGCLGIIARKKDPICKVAEKRNFIISKEQEVWMGKQPLFMMVFTRK